MYWIWSNFAVSTLAADIEAVTAVITVPAGDADLFPEPGEVGETFSLVLENEDASLREIVWCTSRIDGSLSVQRGAEQTAALAWPEGTIVRHELTAEPKRWMSEAAFDFNARYVGRGPINPTTDRNGNDLEPGALFYNTSDQGFVYWDGAEWLPWLGGAAGVSEFTDLSDVPDYYTGYGGWHLIVKEDGTGLAFEKPRMVLVGFSTGVLENSQELIRFVVPPTITLTFADDFGGSAADVDIAATAPATFTIAVNGVAAGTCVITGTTPVFVTSGGTVVAEPGDVITATGPSSADATLAKVTLTLMASLVG